MVLGFDQFENHSKFLLVPARACYLKYLIIFIGMSGEGVLFELVVYVITNSYMQLLMLPGVFFLNGGLSSGTFSLQGRMINILRLLLHI